MLQDSSIQSKNVLETCGDWFLAISGSEQGYFKQLDQNHINDLDLQDQINSTVK
jgi:hypothetical protein